MVICYGCSGRLVSPVVKGREISYSFLKISVQNNCSVLRDIPEEHRSHIVAEARVTYSCLVRKLIEPYGCIEQKCGDCLNVKLWIGDTLHINLMCG